jgi:head-tail adaptor
VTIGRRTTLATIEKSTSTQTVGEPVLVWTVHGTWWHDKLPLGGSEGPGAGQEQFGVAHYERRGGYFPGVTTKMRLNERGVLHDIDFVDETERRQGKLRLVTTQRGA